MKYLYCPWRSTYATTIHSKDEDTPEKECIFCEQFRKNNDEEYFIIKRFTYNAVKLNRYPYNAGHLLIMPFEHISALEKLSHDTQVELMELTTKSINVLKKILNAEGINIGMNLGKAAGAGIPSHLHMHVLPRWVGDTNFMPLIAQTKTIAFDLNDIYKKLKTGFEEIT